jgi:hypothetical protein
MTMFGGDAEARAMDFLDLLRAPTFGAHLFRALLRFPGSRVCLRQSSIAPYLPSLETLSY